jgi:hypothetical protein
VRQRRGRERLVPFYRRGRVHGGHGAYGVVTTSKTARARLLWCSTGLGSKHLGEGDARTPSWRSLGGKHGLLLSTQNLVTTSIASSGRMVGCIGREGRALKASRNPGREARHG